MMQVLLLGQSAHREFSGAADWLKNRLDIELVFAAAPSDALAVLERSRKPPQVVVACQTRPGEITQPHIEQLRAAAPLARMVVLMGGWCEGEPRVARRLQGVARVHWTRWRQALPAALDLSATSPGSIWRLPLTATDAEQTLHAARRPLPRGAGAISIWTDRFDKFQAPADVCAAAGYSAVWLPSSQAVVGAVAAIWDGDIDAPRQVAALRELSTATNPGPTVVLADFPRAEDVRLAVQCGAAAVLAKPYLIDELLAALDAQGAPAQDEVWAA